MKNYLLSENEVILFRGMVALLSDWKEEKKIQQYNTELILTNFNVVLNKESKKLFHNVVDKKIYSVSDIKIYDETVQIIRRKNVVDIYFMTGEIFVKFEKEKHAKEFCDKAIKLRDGNSKFVRSVKKTRKVIKETNEALDINIVEIAKTTAAVACDVATGLGSVSGAGKTTKMIAKVANVLRGKSKKNELNNALSERISIESENENELDDSLCKS